MGALHRKIVVVEDEPEVRELETFLLESEGYDVAGAPDGESAGSIIKEEQPDLVLLDLMLPGKDGNGVLQDLQRDPSTASIPVIVVSAYTERLQLTPQVKRIIPKPFELPELLDAVAREVGHHPAAEGSAAP